MEESKYLRNAELVRQKIDHMLPPEGPISFDALNYNVRMLVNTPKSISSGIPLSMASLIANYQMANFASQFQLKIQLGNSKIPVNMVGFVLAMSGGGKDSTVNAMEKAMDFGYGIINEKRKEEATALARRRAEEIDGDADNWRQYYREPQPLSNAISTVEGLVSRLNQFAQDGIGMPSVYVGELGSELQTNPNITDNIRLISELFDEGMKKSKAIKDSERQDQEVSGMGMCALFVGSEDNIIMDKSVAAKFKAEFVTKLARRSMFVYPSKQEFDSCIPEYQTYEQMIEHQEVLEQTAMEGRAYIASRASDVATLFLERDSRLLELSDEALAAYKDYKLFTTNLGLGTSYIYKSVELEQIHRSWKMLKLAGVYAVWDSEETIQLKHIEQAIYFVEKIGAYMQQYEEFASKEPYELLVDLFKHNPDISLSLHELKKRGFITGTAQLDTKVKELVRLADSFAGADGSVEFSGDTVRYKPFEKVGDHFASYVQVSGTKQERAFKCHSGFISKPTSFEKLVNLMQNDTAYTPFKFQDGKRSNDNIISGATWVALDIDDSDISLYEMHDIMGDYNHHIATTSDPENIYKFRLIVEFNNIVDLPPREWKIFGKLLGKEFGINIDPATFTKSQIMFGYKGATVLSLTEAEPFDVSPVVKDVKAEVENTFKKPVQLTRTKMRSMLDNPLETFWYAFNDDIPARSLAMYKMWRHAKELGATPDECEQLMRDLNDNFWSNPISDERLEGYIKQMRRAYEEEK